ncbi:MAG: LTA synthase family protein [Butyricicoccus sp.]
MNSSHFRRQLCALRTALIFFAAWAVLDPAFTEYPHLTILLAGCFGLAFLLPRRLSGAAAVWAPRTVWAFGPPLALLVVELLNNTDPFEALSVVQCILNLVWYYLFFALLTLLFGRIRSAAALGMVLSFLIGLANHYVLTFRGRIIFPIDLVAWRTALNVADGFDYTPDETICRAALFALAYLIVLCRLMPQPHARRPRRRVVLIGAAASAVYCALFFGTGMLTFLGIYAQQWKTQANGFVLNFTAALRYSIVTKPDGYSAEAVQDIIDALPEAEPPTGQQPVHILAIMNESFADLSSYDTLDLTEDPTPFLHSMQENTIRGTMYSPVTGGGTANVEFEFLTGNPLAFLPASTVAYQLYLEDNTPSLVSQVEALGYSSAAFHPYQSSGWNRTSVYEWMGFDEQLYEEDVHNPEYIRGFISDQSDYEKLYELTDAAGNDPLFVFNVTIQNHSGYQLPWTNLERTSELDGKLEDDFPPADQFFSLMKASDDALRNLISHYSQSDVPTMIIFFGDHQPPLGNDFYEALAGKPLDSRTTEEVFRQYTTPFFIWANYDIPEAENVVTTSWGLHLLTAEAANLPLTGYQRFLKQVAKQVPVITPVGYITADGRYSSDAGEALTPAEKALVQQYRILSYNNLFSGDSRADGFFFPK